MSDVCDNLQCTDSETRTESLLLENLAYWIPEQDAILSEDNFPILAEDGSTIQNVGAANIKQPVIRAALYDEAIILAEDGTPILDENNNTISADAFDNCSQEITSRQLFRMLFTSGRKIRVVIADETFEEVDCNAITFDLNDLFRMAITKTTDGCTALRIHIIDSYDLLTCADELNTMRRIKTAFYINERRTKASLGVVLNGFVADGFISCGEFPNGVSVYQMLSRLFILKKDNNYFPSLSYSTELSEGYLQDEETGHHILSEDDQSILT